MIIRKEPGFVKSYDDTGKLIGIDLLAYVGWLHACLKGFMTKINLSKGGEEKHGYKSKS